MHRVLKYRGVVFDDYAVGDNSMWSYICSDCYEKHAYTLNENTDAEVDTEAICGVEGCWNNNWSDDCVIYYIDFDPNQAEFTQGRRKSSPIMVVGNNKPRDPEIVIDFVDSIKEALLKDNQVYRQKYEFTNFIEIEQLEEPYRLDYKIGDHFMRPPDPEGTILDTDEYNEEEPTEEPGDVEKSE